MHNQEHLSILVLFGIGIFGGIIGSYFFKLLRMPLVVGYIVIGLIIGQSGFNFINHSDVLKLQSFNWFALGIIGFLVGGELKISIFKKYWKQFSAILFGEGLLAFFIVSIPVGLLVYHTSHMLNPSIAAGIVFGAIASATDPASTTSILWEYRCKGVLTTALIATVALDDALAITLYGIGTSIAGILAGGGQSILMASLNICKELIGSIVLGVLAAFLLSYIISALKDNKDKILAIAIGILLTIIGFASSFGLDVILVTMAMGCVLVNLKPKRSHDLFSLVQNFSIPIYVMFFVLVGARLSITQMPLWLWGTIAIYVIGRSIGKMSGAYIGAKLTNAEKKVQLYTGMGLFSQGGVAIGLSIMASTHLSHIFITPSLSLGDTIIMGIASSTFILQIVGPPLVKLAVTMADEKNKDITEDDIIKTLKTSDVLSKDFITIESSMPIEQIFKVFTNNTFISYPVTENNKVIGTLELDSFKNILDDPDCWKWLIATDMLEGKNKLLYKNMPLAKALATMNDLSREQMTVVNDLKNQTAIGILDKHTAKQYIKKLTLEKGF